MHILKRCAVALGSLLVGLSIATVASPAQASGPGYYYAGAAQSLVASGITVPGISANLWIANPYMQANSGEHTLMEVTGKNNSTNDRVEIGWVKDGSGAGGPRLFIYYWVAGSPVNCYYGCAAWVARATTPAPRTAAAGSSNKWARG